MSGLDIRAGAIRRRWQRKAASIARHCFLALFAIIGAMSDSIEPAFAHSPSNAYLNLSVSGDWIAGQWDIALRDLELAIGLDSDQDGAIEWGELSVKHDAIAAYALSRLTLRGDTGVCPARAVDHLVDRHGEGGYAVLRFTAQCPPGVGSLNVDYNLLFDIDPLHRGLTQINYTDISHTVIFSPERRTWQVQAGVSEGFRQFKTYVKEGIWHILIGFDHVLFLISLLLPAVLRRGPAGWQPVSSLRSAFLEVVKIVTAFTIAHSVTLGLATAGWLALPSRIVEPVIAATIIIAALNNIYPMLTRGLWVAAFGFGLIHGIGFAGALQALDLPSDALLVSLLSFNLGVETGQLAIVAAFLPIAYLIRRSVLYPRLVLQFGSTAIAFVAAVWLVERAFDVTLIS